MIFSFCKFPRVSLLLAGCCAAVSLHAQTPASPAAPPARESRQKNGYLRFWNMLPKESGELVLIKDNGTPEGEPLLSAAPANFYASYIPLPVGRYALKLVRREAPEAVIQTLAMTLRSEDSVTFLASAADRKLKVEMLDDTYDPAAALAGRLTIRQYFPDARVLVSVGPQVKSRELSPGETEIIEGIPLQSYELKMRATLAGGKTESWSTEVNFQTLRHATLLVVPDPYGRFRPRLAVDGRAPTAAVVAPAAVP
jgi:hypothetical protein